MITRTDYFMGRDVAYPRDMTPEIEANSAVIIERANLMLAQFGESRKVNSGWRPPAVNASTPGAAAKSKHMTAQAVDLADPEGDLDEWLLANQNVLVTIGLWQENPATTKGWVHVQCVPPRSGNRVFYP